MNSLQKRGIVWLLLSLCYQSGYFAWRDVSCSLEYLPDNLNGSYIPCSVSSNHTAYAMYFTFRLCTSQFEGIKLNTLFRCNVLSSLEGSVFRISSLIYLRLEFKEYSVLCATDPSVS